MKIAFCFTGQLRTGVLASPNILNYIGDLLPYVKFFTHTWGMNSRKPLYQTAIERSPYFVTSEEIQEFCRIYNMGISQCELTHWTPEFETLSKDSKFSPMYYSFRRSMQLVQSYEKNNNYNFDLMIKFRPDLLLDPRRKLSIDILRSFSSVNFDINDKLFAENSPYGQKIDDVYFIAKPDVMYRFSDFNEYLKNTGDHNENNYLQTVNITTHPILKPDEFNGYSIYREECTHIDPMHWDECFNCNHDHYDKPKPV